MSYRKLSMFPGQAATIEGLEYMKGMQKRQNILKEHYDTETKRFRFMDATQFANIWNHFDQDGNGFIEGDELSQLLKELVESLVPEKTRSELSFEEMQALINELITAIDKNGDSRIDIRELAQLLPTDEEFLFLFRRENRVYSSIDFMKVWKTFDKDRSGFIEADELKNFLSQLLQSSIRNPKEKITDEKLIEYTDNILKIFDQNGDGKLQLSEMARLLPVKENYLCRPIFKNAEKITSADIDRIFELYDQDRNGSIQDEELSGFLKDLLELAQEDYDENDLEFTKKLILQNWDVNHDGKINIDEMKMLLSAQVRPLLYPEAKPSQTG